MELTKISRSYSRSTQIKKPDGTEMWIKHEMTAEASLGEDDSIRDVSAGLEEICRKDVGTSTTEEKKKILASFDKVAPTDEPFPGKTPGVGSKAKKMPKLSE